MNPDKRFRVSYTVLIMVTLLFAPKLSGGIASYYCAATDSCEDRLTAVIRHTLPEFPEFTSVDFSPTGEFSVTGGRFSPPRLARPPSTNEMATLLNLRITTETIVQACRASILRNGIDPVGTYSQDHVKQFKEQLNQDFRTDSKFL
jgi:hypothetical protein